MQDVNVGWYEITKEQRFFALVPFYLMEFVEHAQSVIGIVPLRFDSARSTRNIMG